MILIHSSLPFDKKETDNQINLVRDQLSVFFVDDNDILFSTETNQKLIRETIRNHKIFLFYTGSIREMGLSPADIAELIIFMIRFGNNGNGGCFWSEIDNLNFSKENIDDVYPVISGLFRE